MEDAGGHRRRRGARERQERPGVGRERPVPVLVVGLEGRADDAGRRRVHEHVERAERADLVRDALRCDVASDEHGLDSERRQLGCRLLRHPVAAHVADRDPLRAERREAEGDGLADAPRSSRDEDGGSFERHSR